ncbi:MerR family transcriptional regulator [Gracilibacillus sp. Marseille-QA3620]
MAELSKVHPNIVRLYEEWQFISLIPRKSNGYRVYSDLNLKQMKIARHAFRQEFIQNNLRKRATKIVDLAVENSSRRA